MTVNMERNMEEVTLLLELHYHMIKGSKTMIKNHINRNNIFSTSMITNPKIKICNSNTTIIDL